VELLHKIAAGEETAGNGKKEEVSGSDEETD
jgi:hypothetical protein